MLTSRSRQSRNPRYAPEGLERKLNPTAIVAPMPTVTAPVVTVYTSADDTTDTTDSGDTTDGDGAGDPTLPTDPDPEPGTGLPPALPSNPPGGPVLPA